MLIESFSHDKAHLFEILSDIRINHPTNIPRDILLVEKENILVLEILEVQFWLSHGKYHLLDIIPVHLLFSKKWAFRVASAVGLYGHFCDEADQIG